MLNLSRWPELLGAYAKETEAIDNATPLSQQEKARRNTAAKNRLLSQLPFVLSKDDQEIASARFQSAKASGTLPAGLYSTGLWQLFNCQRALNSYDYALLCGPLMMYAIQGLIDEEIASIYSLVFEAINRLWAKTFKRVDVPKLQRLMKRALLQAHIHIPAVHHDFIVHLLYHVVCRA